jgi:hypothetical protein
LESKIVNKEVHHLKTRSSLVNKGSSGKMRLINKNTIFLKIVSCNNIIKKVSLIYKSLLIIRHKEKNK